MYIDAPGELSGFLMEHTATHVVVFDTRDRLLKRGLITHDERIRLELATWYQFMHVQPPKQRREQGQNRNFEFFTAGRRNPQVFARTWAVSPGEDLPVEMREKYKGKVWAPYLGLLNDTDGMFERTFAKEVFELEQVAERGNDFLLPDRPAPWNQPTFSIYYDAFPSRKITVNGQACARFSLCVRDVADNLAYNEKHHGSTATCSQLVSSIYGVVRSLYLAEMGCWYQHSIKINNMPSSEDTKQEDSSTKHLDFIHAYCTASKIMKIPPPLPTEVVDDGHDVEVTTKFVFEHDHFEKEWSRGLSNWKERKEGVQTNIFFYDVYLGKVRIPIDSAIDIIKLAENLQKDCYERMMTDKISVTVKVQLLKDFLRRNNRHPDNQLYVVKSVVDVEHSE
ncbi:hypothetical protein GCK72_004158 [Caenorhabditis remanei]|uniref:Uncharacterized protein n=1 Tax=Caenorhabditis remanei TaxID=31234 RepID=A0A6A5HBF1_CAERE|nr:hypothetical protein GCK72_004158 [Caenorhabditis remanei]KAF1764211.1 hypothetical protein GCK72_004158 [Caenorhabditis remanei]